MAKAVEDREVQHIRDHLAILGAAQRAGEAASKMRFMRDAVDDK